MNTLNAPVEYETSGQLTAGREIKKYDQFLDS